LANWYAKSAFEGWVTFRCAAMRKSYFRDWGASQDLSAYFSDEHSRRHVFEFTE
jgi:hypothetical protein